MPTHTVVPPSILRHFAPRRDKVQALAALDQQFCDMCEEYAAAEAALARFEVWPPDLRGERLEECQGWIERLIAEMDDALCSAKYRSRRARLPCDDDTPPPERTLIYPRPDPTGD